MVIDSVLGPWRPDVADLNNGGVTVARNVIPGIGNAQGGVSYRPVRRASVYSSTASLPSRPVGSTVGQDKFGNAKVYCGTANGLFKIMPDRTWQDISKTGGYTTATTEKWRFTEYGSFQVGCNYSNYLQYIDMNDDTKWDDLTTLVQARRITTIKDFIVVGNTFDALDGNVPYRVRWSALGNPSDWNYSVQTQSDFQDLIGGGAVQAVVGGESGTIFLQRSIWKMTYVGSPLVFQFDEIIKGKGCSLPESVITVEGKTYFVSDDGFYVMEGAAIRPIGVGKVDRYFLDAVDGSQSETMTVSADPREKLIYWSYKSKTSSSSTADRVMVFNYQTEEWSEQESTVAFVFNSLSLPTTLDQLDVYGTIDQVPASFDSPLWAGGNAMLWGMDVAGKIYVFGGENLPAVIETQEYYLSQIVQVPSETTVVTRVRPLFHGNGGTAQVSMGSRRLPNAQVVWTHYLQQHPETGWVHCRQFGRFHRVRLLLTGTWEQAISLQIDAVGSGSR